MFQRHSSFPFQGPKGAIGVGWFGSATNSRSELHKHRFTIQVICIAGFYRLKDLVAPPEEPTQWRLSKREQILVGVAKGMSSEEIGDMLHLRSNRRLAHRASDEKARR